MTIVLPRKSVMRVGKFVKCRRRKMPRKVYQYLKWWEAVRLAKYRFNLEVAEWIGLPKQSLEATLKLAILDIEYSLESHQGWGEKCVQASLSKRERRMVGNAKHHTRCIQNYKRVLRILYSLEVDSCSNRNQGGAR
jgi:hypothetical protein